MSFAATVLRIASGPIAWIFHFAAIYGATALACARGMPQMVPWAIGLATVAAVAACAMSLAVQWPRRTEFESWLGASLAGSSLIAILLQAFPVLVVPICG
jgi:hypothetical protein